MKVLYITDDRSQYRQGNYYLAYLHGFSRKHDVVVSDLSKPVELNNIELIVLGHGGQDVLLKLLRAPGAENIPGPVSRNLEALSLSEIPKVVLSKNDYSALERKKKLQQLLRANLLVTHSKSAVPELSHPSYRTIWIPFGIDTNGFRNLNLERKYAIGFRANRNAKWCGDLREKFFNELAKTFAGKYKTDLVLADEGDSFLLGDDYIRWLNSCSLLANTVSAIGTVGPRFLESIACGCVPLAPPDEYEGLLEADRHYLAVNDWGEMEQKVERFFVDENCRRALLDNGQKLLQEHTVEKHVEQIVAELR